MSGLPKGWVEATLDELVATNGVVTDGDWVESKDQDPNGDVRLTQLADVGEGEFRNRSDRYLTRETAEQLGCTFLEPGDVLIARMPDPLGRACIFPGLSQPAVTVVDVLVFRSGTDLVSPHWIMSAINAPETRQRIIAQASGTTRQRISGGNLKRLPLPLPPLAEQRRIVAKLDALNAKSARTRTELARIETLVFRYKQAVLSKAFSGELTSAEVSTWAACTLGDLALDVRYGTAEKCTYAPDLTPVLRIPNVANGRIDLSDLKHASFNDKELSKLALIEGDLLVIRSNGSIDLVGRSAIVDSDAAGMLFAGYLIRIRLDLTKALPPFIQHWMQSLAVRRTIEDAAKSTSGVNNVNSQQLQALQLRLPSLEAQDEIVHRIKTAFAKIDRLAGEAKRALELVGKLDEAILAKAFRGKLVSQDESDEPAEQLLARIRAKRQAAPKGKRERGR